MKRNQRYKSAETASELTLMRRNFRATLNDAQQQHYQNILARILSATSQKEMWEALNLAENLNRQHTSEVTVASVTNHFTSLFNKFPPPPPFEPTPCHISELDGPVSSDELHIRPSAYFSPTRHLVRMDLAMISTQPWTRRTATKSSACSIKSC